jgi:PAS domain S-box-containing protein
LAVTPIRVEEWMRYTGRQAGGRAGDDAYRIALTDVLRAIADPVVIQREAARLLGEHLNASRVYYGQAVGDGCAVSVRADYCVEGVSSIVGRHCLDDCVSVAMAELHAGRTLAISDISIDDRLSQEGEDRKPLARAFVLTPLVKEGRLDAALGVHQIEPRAWTRDEIALIEETAERTWAAVERAQAEAALRQSQSDFIRAQEVGQIGWWRLDTTRNVLTWSDEIYRIFGVLKGTQLSYETFLALVHPDDRAYVDEKWRAGLRGEPYDIQHRIIADGHIKWVREKAYLELDETGSLRGGFGIAQDISERKRSEEALQKSEACFRAVFEHAATGITIADLDGRLIQTNPAFRRLLGYERHELDGVAFAELVHPDDRAANLLAVRRLREEELPTCEIENRYLRKDGKVVWVHKFISLLHDARGAPSHFVALVTDVTERRRMEDALRESDQRKDEFLATLAHELRNPLAPISNALHVLGRLGAPPEMEKLIGLIRRQVIHLIRLVDDLMEVSRISRGKVELRRQPVDLAAVIGQAIETSEPFVEAGGHELRVELCAEPLIVGGDSVRLAQVFANLVNNAAKFTPPGGRIELTMEARAGEAAVRVRDNGVGISSEMLPRVFDLFSQAERRLDGVNGGLGIGLALVRSLVELHDGRVEASSAGLGRGSEFIVSLPLTESVLGDPNIEREAGEAPETARRVLVIDDNRDVAESLAMLLDTFGADVRTASSGPAGLDALAEFAPELVFLDLGMPGMDGYETARRIRERPEGRGVLLVALTGWGQDGDRDRTREAGFDRHLVKPADLDALQALLATLEAR